MVRKVFCLSPKAGTEINVYFITTKKREREGKTAVYGWTSEYVCGAKSSGRWIRL